MGESVVSKFHEQVRRLGTRPAFRYKKEGVWQVLSWAQAGEETGLLSRGLVGLGLRKGDRVALLSQTRVEWTLLDMAILSLGAVTVPIYPTLSDEQAGLILENAQVSLLIVENAVLKKRLAKSLARWTGKNLLIDGMAAGWENWESLKEKGSSVSAEKIAAATDNLAPDDEASLIYTSGTTGLPKGAILTHRNFLAETESLREAFLFPPEAIGMMALPLAHVLARAFQFYLLAQGCQTAFAESIEQLPANLQEIHPHLMLGVPRLFEKSHEKIKTRVRSGPKWRQKLFDWSLSVGTAKSRLLQRKLPVPVGLRLRAGLARLLVYRKIAAGFGGRVEIMISGGAPLSQEIALFFHAIGMLVLEGYGLTETFAASTVNRRDDFCFGTVGKPLSCCRVKICEDGEIAVKGENVFSGYYQNKEATREVFDKEGWFLTGDIGEFTKEGFLRITDRKKDIIVTASGKNIAPQSIEARLKESPYFQQVMVHGDRERFLTALLTLNWEPLSVFARQKGIEFRTRAELASHPFVTELVDQEITACNAKLSQYETIKKYAILDADFSIETGELTPTLKVKRKEVARKYQHILERMYR